MLLKNKVAIKLKSENVYMVKEKVKDYPPQVKDIRQKVKDIFNKTNRNVLLFR